MRNKHFALLAIGVSSAVTLSCAKVNFATQDSVSPASVTTTTTRPGTTTTTTMGPGTTTTSTTTSTTTTTTTRPPTTTTTVTTTTTRPPTTTVPPYVTRTKNIMVTPTMTSVDILVVVDDSSSMAQDNMKLASRLSGFVSGLQAGNLDWQMCITTTDLGYYQGRPIVWSGTSSHRLNKNSGNLSAIFQQTIYDIGSGYSNDEQGIKASVYSVMGNASSQCYRPQAALAVILISDEDERSVGGVYNLSSAQYKAMTPENYPQAFINTVASTFNGGGFSKKIAFNSIVVTDAACEAQQDAQGTPSFIGQHYMQLTGMTAGAVGSICTSDYSSHLNIFRVNILNTVSSVDLECVPTQTPTISPSGYAFTMQGKRMIFNPALQEGTNITITYRCPL